MQVAEIRKPTWQKVLTLMIMVLPCFAVLAAALAVSNSPYRGQLWYTLTILAFLVVGVKLRLMGISLGFHRGLTHTSYETHPWLRKFFLILGCMCIQGEPVYWATDHTEHHRYSDTDKDPHSPIHGFWHAHWGWLVDHPFNRELNPVFKNDADAMWVSKRVWLWVAIGLIVPALVGQWVGIGWWDGFLWGGAVAIFFANQGTYWVNSGAHTFGQRHFQTDDLSTNFWLKGIGWPFSFFMAWLTWGETNHNNHHAIMKSANHGMFKGQFDPSANLLRVLEKLGLVWNVQWTDREAAERRQRELEMSPEERKADALRRHLEQRERDAVPS